MNYTEVKILKVFHNNNKWINIKNDNASPLHYKAMKMPTIFTNNKKKKKKKGN